MSQVEPVPSLIFRFAQISDPHLANQADPKFAVREQLLARAVAEINAFADLDCVLVTGDLIDFGLPAELDTVIGHLRTLRVPWYAIPGNHDIAFPPQDGLLNRQRFYEQIAAATLDGATVYDGTPERGSWTTVVKPGVRLIGLDSNIAGTWAGVVDAGQMAWLETTLAAATEPLVVLAVHHPLWQIFEGWERPSFSNQPWGNFFCGNGEEVRALLARYPQVRVVVSGHDHISRVQELGGQLFIASPALSGYPLAYRIITVQQTPDGWTCTWQTHSPADATDVAQAMADLESMDLAVSYYPADPHRFSVVSHGAGNDQTGHHRFSADRP